MRVLFRFATTGWGGNEIMACRVARQFAEAGAETRILCEDETQIPRIRSLVLGVEVGSTRNAADLDGNWRVICIASSFLHYVRRLKGRQPRNEWVYTPFWGYEFFSGVCRLSRALLVVAARRTVAPRTIGVHHRFGAAVTFPNVPVNVASPMPGCSSTELVCFARVEFVQKRQNQLLARYLDDGLFPEARLMFVGSGPDSDRLDALLRPAARGATLKAWHDNPANLYHNGSVAVLPSKFEGLPLAGIEALASGVPVICTSGSNLSEFLPKSCHFDLRQHGSLKSALRFAVENRAEIVSAAQLVIRRRYSGEALDAAVRDWLSLGNLIH
jgi:glycosyltransferase involved in cell wall biosynthesis